MKKKELKSIPIAKANMEAIHDIAVAGKGKRGVITVQNVKNGAEEVLVLNVYQTSGRNKRDISLLFRVFCQKEDYITLEVECNKWRTAALLNLVCRDAGWAAYWWNYEQLEFLTAADARKAENVYHKWLKDKKIIQIKPHLNYSTDIRKISKQPDLLRNIKKKQILLIWKWRSLEIYRMIIKFLLKK